MHFHVEQYYSQTWNCTDLVDGHVVVSTNYAYIRNDELRQQFYYGSVFKLIIDSSDSILESISLGINDYIAKISKSTALNAQEVTNLEEWKQSILQLCHHNLNQHRH